MQVGFFIRTLERSVSRGGERDPISKIIPVIFQRTIQLINGLSDKGLLATHVPGSEFDKPYIAALRDEAAFFRECSTRIAI